MTVSTAANGAEEPEDRKVYRPRPRPCASCPYRRDVPSGVWAVEEYVKLPPYDKDMAYQPPGLFMCHQQDGHLCSGWLACHGADNLLAIRIGAVSGYVDPEEVFDYSTEVPLWKSGAQTAQHGLRDYERPERQALEVQKKIERLRAARDARRQED